MQNQDLKEIQIVRTPHHKRIKLLVISIISLLALIAIVFFINKDNTQTEAPQAIYKDPTPAIKRESISGWSTYDADNFSFDYPSDYQVSETNGIYSVSKERIVITVDGSTSGINSNYNQAVNSARNNLTEQAEREISNGIKMFGKVKERGTPQLSAFLRYGSGTLVIQTSEESEAIFDQIVSSVQLK